MAVALIAHTIEKDAKRGRSTRSPPLRFRRRRARSVLSAVRVAAKDDDLEIRVTGLARLLESPSDRADAIRELEPIAGREQGLQSRRALFALASAGHHRIQAWVERELSAQQPEARFPRCYPS